METQNIKSPIQHEDVIEAQIKDIVPDAYIIRERIDKCTMCGREEDLRMGWCWDCAEAQNIIGNGVGMFEDEVEGVVEFDVKLVNERLKKLIDLGWKKVGKEQ